MVVKMECQAAAGGNIKTLKTTGKSCPDNTTTQITVDGLEKIYQVSLQSGNGGIYATAYLDTDTDQYVFINGTYSLITAISGNVVSVKLQGWGSAMNASLICTGV